MEGKNGKEEPATLESGLNFWSRQEQKFQSLFGKEALKDREFLKMKLRHYDHLWYQYKNAPLDIEGQLMRNILKFQRRKIDKSMHRRLLRQIIRRVTAAIESNRVQKVQRKMDNKDRLELYNENSPKPEMHTQAKKTFIDQKKKKQEDKVQTRMEQTIQQPKGTRWERKKLYSHNHAPLYNHKQRKSKGIHP